MPELLPYQERVVTEKSELDDKITKLSEFSNGDFFKTMPEAEQFRLMRDDYSTVLGERIAAF